MAIHPINSVGLLFVIQGLGLPGLRGSVGSSPASSAGMPGCSSTGSAEEQLWCVIFAPEEAAQQRVSTDSYMPVVSRSILSSSDLLRKFVM